MKVTAIYTSVFPNSNKLDYIFNIFNNTSNELGIKIEIIDITQLNIDYFSGKKVPIIENIFNNIRSSSAIIFACTAKNLSVSGSMQIFLEHLPKGLLQDKPCYTIITSTDGSEFNAGSYLTTVVSLLGGSSIGNMLVGAAYLQGIEASIEITRMIERYAEDFYRLLKQNRKLFQATPFNFNSVKSEEQSQAYLNNYNNTNSYDKNIPKDSFNYTGSSISNGKTVKSLTGQQVSELYQKEAGIQSFYPNKNDFIQKNDNLQESSNFQASKYNNFNNDTRSYTKNYNNNYNDQIQTFNEQQDGDISEITKMLLNEYNTSQNKNSLDTFNIDNTSPKILNGGTCKQRTQSLYHYFQPQIAGSMNIIIQLEISGDEKFSGYLQIKDGECTYFEGNSQKFDVAVIADCSVWEEVLNSKYTLQKAFMLGKVKVKGNFVIISKFEQLFKIN